MKLLKLGSKGYSHIIVPAIVVLAVAGVGVRILLASHADSLPPVLYTDNGSIDLTDVNGVSVTAEKEVTNKYYVDPAYSPNHDYVAFGASTNGQAAGRLDIYNTTTKATTTVVSSDDLEVLGGNGATIPIAWFPNSAELAFVSYNGNANTTQLYTVNENGTDLEAVPDVSASTGASIGSVAVTGDGKYIVYTTGNAVYAVSPGSNPVELNSGSYCTQVVSRPTTSETVSYLCDNYGTNTSTSSVYVQTVGSAPTIAVSSSGSTTSGTGAVIFYEDDAWSYDGTKLALQQTYTRFLSGSCNVNNIPQIAIMYYPRDVDTSIYSFPVNHNTCKGGPGPDKSIAFSPDGSYIAYIDTSPTSGGGPVYIIQDSGGNTPVELSTGSDNNLGW